MSEERPSPVLLVGSVCLLTVLASSIGLMVWNQTAEFPLWLRAVASVTGGLGFGMLLIRLLFRTLADLLDALPKKEGSA